VEDFVWELFWQEREYFLPGLEKQPLFDMAGEPISCARFVEKIEVVWKHLLPTKGVEVKPLKTEVVEEEGVVTAVITWRVDDEQKHVESFFRLQPGSYSGWDIVQTSLLDNLLAALRSDTKAGLAPS
jgi:hypothetical protein